MKRIRSSMQSSKKSNVLSVMTMMLVRIHNSVYDARYNDPILETSARGLYDEVV